jgi:hypothetical protein
VVKPETEEQHLYAWRLQDCTTFICPGELCASVSRVRLIPDLGWRVDTKEFNSSLVSSNNTDAMTSQLSTLGSISMVLILFHASMC